MTVNPGSEKNWMLAQRSKIGGGSGVTTQGKLQSVIVTAPVIGNRQYDGCSAQHSE